jgi:transcription initiation factor TFIIB
MNCEHSLVIDEGQNVCQLCGLMFEKVIDEGAEWRNYEDGKKDEQCRTGFTTSDLLPESSYGSIISFKGLTNPHMKSIQRLSCWSLSSNSERSWMSIFDSITLCCNQAGLPKAIVLDACGLYKNLSDAQKVRGETRRALMGAAVYISCKNNGALRTHEEIANLFVVSIRALYKAVTQFTETDNSVLETQIGIAERLTTAMNMNDEQRDKVMNLLYEISNKSEDDFEHTPKTIVAGVVAHILGLKTKSTMKQLSEISGVSALSISKLVTKLVDN